MLRYRNSKELNVSGIYPVKIDHELFRIFQELCSKLDIYQSSALEEIITDFINYFENKDSPDLYERNNISKWAQVCKIPNDVTYKLNNDGFHRIRLNSRKFKQFTDKCNQLGIYRSGMLQELIIDFVNNMEESCNHSKWHERNKFEI